MSDVTKDNPFYVENKKKLEELGESLKPAGLALKAQVEKLTGELPSTDEVLKKFQDFENKLNDMQVNNEIPLVDDSLFKFTNDDDYDSDDD